MSALEKRPSRTRLMIPAVIGALFLGITGMQQLSAHLLWLVVTTAWAVMA
jgi:hypothetical protein